MISRRKLLIGSALAAPAILRRRALALPYGNTLQFAMPKWAAAKAAVAAGTRNARLLCVGDSYQAGFGAGGASGYEGTFPLCYPSKSAVLKNTAGPLKWSTNSMWGNGMAWAAANSGAAYDTRRSIGGGWTESASGLYSLGSHFYISGSTGTFGFTPSGTVDTADIYYPQSLDIGVTSIAVNFNGGSTLATLNNNSGTSPGVMAKSTVTFTAGTGPINLVSANGAFIGIDAYLSTAKQVSVWNGGWFGSSTADWVLSAGYNSDPLPAIGAVQPDLTALSLGGNDILDPVAIGTFAANLVTIIKEAQLSGDVLFIHEALVEPNSIGATGFPEYVSQNAYHAVMTEICQQYHINTVDFRRQFPTWSYMNGNSLAYDNIHPNNGGYAVLANALAGVL